MNYNKIITDYIIDIASHKVEADISRGHAIAGHNGAYNEFDTPVRNTAHWLITYSYLYKATKDVQYKVCATKFCEFLLDKKNYGTSGAIICRTNGNYVDQTNGLVGQAWVIDALMYAYETFGDKKLLDAAISIYKAQKYDFSTHSWQCYDVDGRYIGHNAVFNHNLWFAVSIAKVVNYSVNAGIEREIQDFVSNCSQLFYTHSIGLLSHTGNTRSGYVNKIKLWRRRLLCETAHVTGLFQDYNKFYIEKGYHLFDMFGFAKLHNIFPDAQVFDSNKFKSALKYAISKEYLHELLEPDEKERAADKRHGDKNYNVYAYGYNSPAIELPYITKEFYGSIDEDLCVGLLDNQLALNYSDKTHMFSENICDPETGTARICEWVAFLDGATEN